jgi:hypothetical protein
MAREEALYRIQGGLTLAHQNEKRALLKTHAKTRFTRDISSRG